MAVREEPLPTPRVEGVSEPLPLPLPVEEELPFLTFLLQVGGTSLLALLLLLGGACLLFGRPSRLTVPLGELHWGGNSPFWGREVYEAVCDRLDILSA